MIHHLANKPIVRIVFIGVLWLVWGAKVWVYAQDNGSLSSVSQGSSGAPLSIQEAMQASFNVEPVVHRFAGRRGELIPFSFKITSTGRAMNVSVKAVNLRQEESGNILHDNDSEPSDVIRFTSPTEFQLESGSSRDISGEITVPLTRSNFLSFGILVKDNGVSSGPLADGPLTSEGTRASIRFVTQYVLRVDIETTGLELKELAAIELENGSIQSLQGLPFAEVYLNNPADFALECHLDAMLGSSGSRRDKTVPLGLPSRMDMPEPDRYLIRLMPRSRVRVLAPLDWLLLPGEQQLEFSLRVGRREVRRKSFTSTVVAGQFPALDVKRKVLKGIVSIEPAHLELGRVAGMPRLGSFRVMNQGDETQQLSVEFADLEGQPLAGLKFSHAEISLEPGKSKNIRATLQALEGVDRPQYGYIVVRDAAGDESTQIPVSLLYGKASAPQIELLDFSVIPEDVAPPGDVGQGFIAEVVNRGPGFAPLHGELEINDSDGRVWSLVGGYGEWLEPEGARKLEFRARRPLPQGDYRLTLTIRVGEQVDPLVRTFDVRLGAPATSGEAGTEVQSGQTAAL
jgi:hypothetical protein